MFICNVDVVLMYCMNIPAFIVTSAASYGLFTSLLREAICCCLQTCNVYETWIQRKLAAVASKTTVGTSPQGMSLWLSQHSLP